MGYSNKYKPNCALIVSWKNTEKFFLTRDVLNQFFSNLKRHILVPYSQAESEAVYSNKLTGWDAAWPTPRSQGLCGAGALWARRGPDLERKSKPAMEGASGCSCRQSGQGGNSSEARGRGLKVEG